MFVGISYINNIVHWNNTSCGVLNVEYIFACYFRNICPNQYLVSTQALSEGLSRVVSWGLIKGLSGVISQ